MSSAALSRDIQMAKNDISPRPSEPFVNELVERCMYMERILKHKIPQLDLSTRSLQRESEALAAANISRHENAEGSASQDEGDVEIEDERCTIDPITDNVAHYSGEFSYWNFSMRIKDHVKDLMATPNDPGSNQLPHYWREALLSDVHNVREALSCCPPRQIADFLIHVFFKHAATNYFYVDRSWLVDRMNQVYERPSTLSPKDVSIAGIILMALAVGTQYAHLESTHEGGGGWDTHTHEAGNLFYRQAAKLLTDIIHLGSLESVQACLLFGLYALPIDASGLAYVYLNMALKIAMQNGMHRKPPATAFTPTVIETRNRVWWTTYCTEKKIGIFHGRPTSVLPSDTDAALPRDDRADMSRIPHTLVSIQLMDRLGAISNDIMLLRKCQKNELPGILNRLTAMKDNLRMWWEDLPAGPAGQKLSPQSQHFRPNTHLQLEYCLVRMFTGRPFLLTRRTTGLTPASTSESGNSPIGRASLISRPASMNIKNSSRASVLVEDCAQAAKEAIDICSSLRESGLGLARASYVEYSSCRASLLVLIAYCIQNQTDEFYETLEKGLNIIREMSTVGESARTEVFLIEVLEQALKRLHFFGDNTKRPKSSDLHPTAAGYEKFRQWTRSTTSGDRETASGHDSAGTNGLDDSSRRTVPTDGLGWRTSRGNGDAMQEGLLFAGSDADTSGLGTLQSAAGSAFFTMENFAQTPDGFVHPESQLLENFLAIPDYEFPFGVD
nr:hypothetical protein LTR18_001977 [Exophiala xenobiotica]